MYGYLDWILPWYLDDYVTLTSQQKELFDRSTEEFLLWHRNEELPRYAKFFTSLKEAQDAPMDKEQVLFFLDDLENLWLALVERSMSDLLLLATQLSDKQIEQIDVALADEVAELQEKYGNRTEEKQKKLWRSRMEETLENWLGDVTDNQEKLIADWSEERINTTSDWVSYRSRWHQRFIALLNERNLPDFAVEMENFLLSPDQLYTLEYQKNIEINRQGLARLIASISETMTTRQRDHFKEELADIVDSLNELAQSEA